MKSKPFFFSFMSALFLMLAIAMPIQIVLIYQYSFSDVSAILNKLTTLNWVLMGLFVALSALTYKVNQNVIYLLPVTTLLVTVNNWSVSKYGQNFNLEQTAFATICFLAINLTFYREKVFKCLTLPQFRWWNSDPRTQAAIPIEIKSGLNTIGTFSFDISQTGMFIEEDTLLKLSRLKVGDTIDLSIKLDGKIINKSAKIVRRSNAQGHYPSGIGVQFLGERLQTPLLFNQQLN